jgi:lysozyme
MIDTIVDINHDNEIDFAKAETNGVIAIIHKASEGATFKDNKYRSRRDTAIGIGFLWGAYHFSSSRPSSDQVDNFLDVIQWGTDSARDKQTLICLDWEPSTSGPDMTLTKPRISSSE